MNKFLLSLIFGIVCKLTFGQYSLVKNPESFKTQFIAASAKTNSIASDFTQVKSLTALSERLSSKGKFYFQRSSKVRMEYTTPYPYLMVINGSKVMVKDGAKTNTLSAKSNKTFQRINQLMMDSMDGNIFSNTDFSIRVFEDADTYLTEMTPVTSQMKNLFNKVNVIMKKHSFVVQQVQMFEPSGDYTSINYTNQKINIALPDVLFTIK